MLRFESPIYLYFLALIIVLLLIRLLMIRSRKKKLKIFGDPNLIKQLSPDVSSLRRAVKFTLMLVIFALLLVILARPQMGIKTTSEKRSGIEIMICMDISNSMKAKDVVPSRLEKSKMLMENMVDNFSQDKVGLVVFAGDAFIQLPITTDYVSAKMFLSSINPSLIAVQGTNIADAIRIAQNGFGNNENNLGRAIILITDGEDHEGGAVEAARAAHKAGIQVYVLGVGSAEGSPIPSEDGGYMKDLSGETVMSALNEEMCRELATAGGGAYIHVDNTSIAQKTLDQELDKLQKGEISTKVYNEYDEQFQAVALLALLALIIEVMILERKSPLLRRIKFFK